MKMTRSRINVSMPRVSCKVLSQELNKARPRVGFVALPLECDDDEHRLSIYRDGVLHDC